MRSVGKPLIIMLKKTPKIMRKIILKGVSISGAFSPAMSAAISAPRHLLNPYYFITVFLWRIVSLCQKTYT